jgi:uncharacterized LabA/DUF88 family protein
MKDSIKMNNQVVIYETKDGAARIDAYVMDGDIWLTSEKMAQLFGKARPTILEHIKNIYAENELDVTDTKRKVGISDNSTKPTDFYNLSVIIAVGYRVKSPEGTSFRQWATGIMRNFVGRPAKANQAFIDGQNLFSGTTKIGKRWQIDLVKFRVYLRDKYKVEQAYYFFGYVDEKKRNLYEFIQKAGYIVVFRKHNEQMTSRKKGNIDTDLVFSVMKGLYKNEFDKVVIVSGDGDYFRMVDFLIGEKKLQKVLFPNQQFASSLYKRHIEPKYYDYLDSPDVMRKIALKQKGRKAK